MRANRSAEPSPSATRCILEDLDSRSVPRLNVDLRGTKMYVFLGTLTERAFPGLLLPSASTNLQMQVGVSGVVSFSLSLEAMGFLPPNRSQLRCLHEAL